VDSQVIAMEPLSRPVVSEEVFELIRRGFAAPRKKLIHNLAGLKPKDELLAIFDEVKISPDARPGDLKLTDWAKLHKVIKK
jgi:16S rRNA A1518/A1519 N6-dimethyltransferase RsmA/KsgA/DIM1 with predicted DNA glycosylase/AP lyase activity